VQNEGDIGVSTNGPYQISYGSLVPKAGQAKNLLVPVCLSSDGKLAVQDVPYELLQKQLLADGQVLEYKQPPVAFVALDTRFGICICSGYAASLSAIG